jgi:hypothetical protein
MKLRATIGITVALCMPVSQALAAKKILVPKEYPTIQKAIDKAEEWDTVFILNGTYRESVVMREYLVLCGQDMEKTILQGNRSKPVVRGTNYSVIKNMTIEQGEVGILCENTNTLIEHTVIRDNRTGIHCLVSLPEIRNNIINHNRWTGIFCELVAYGVSTAVEHNVIANSGNCGLMLARKSAILVQNNVFYNNKQFGIFVDYDSRKSRIVYNDFFGNRQPFNQFAVVDQTNQGKYPAFPAAGMGTVNFFAGDDSPLKGMGKDGADVGLMSDAARAAVFTDSDGDGIGDAEDKCPDLREDRDEYEDGDGCPDYDNDLDGLSDAQDECPNKPEDFDGYSDQDGCPDPDNDKDGICDPWVAEKGQSSAYQSVCKGSDACPMKPETVNGYKDDDGCPDEKPAK